MVDWYAVLGVEPGADDAAIHAAYRKLARESHPDVNPIPGAAARMREINAAYDQIKDPEKRKAFDESLAALRSAVAQAPAAEPEKEAATPPRPSMRSRVRASAAFNRRVTRPAQSTAPATPHASDMQEAVPGRAASPAPEPGGSADGPAGGWKTSTRVSSAPSPSPGAAGEAATAATWSFTDLRNPRQWRRLGDLSHATPATTSLLLGLLCLVGALAVWAMVAASGAGGMRTAAPARAASARSGSDGYVPASSGARGNRAGTNAAPAPTTGSTNAVSGASSTPAAGTTLSGAAVQATASDFQAPLAPLPIPGATSSAGDGGAPVRAPAAASAGQSQPPVQAQSQPSQAAQAAQRSSLPAGQPGQTSPVITSSGAAGLPFIQEIAGRQASDPPSVAAAQRALSAYDRAWSSYLTALRLASAGGGQTGIARALYLEAQLGWNRQASNTLAAIGRPELPRPDGETEALAILRVNQAADLVNQAQSGTTPAPAAISTQVRALLEEADQLHHAWVVDWARFLADLGT